jgi:hypothetical protein
MNLHNNSDLELDLNNDDLDIMHKYDAFDRPDSSDEDKYENKKSSSLIKSANKSTKIVLKVFFLYFHYLRT